MGKVEDDRNFPSGSEAVGDSSERNARRGGCGCGWISSFVGFKCLFVLILSAAVFLSALFLLPPFRDNKDPLNPDLDPRFRDHNIVASFCVKKPASFLNENILKLENDIFQEMSFDSIKVVILSVDPWIGSNTTKVVFGIDHDMKHREISPISLSAIREIFETVLINQSPFQLTKSLFGEPFRFQVLKFPKGITVIPPQQVFVLQKAQILFNFTLNFSIYQLQSNFNALTSQLKKGLNLAPYENLFVSLVNVEGSTASPPTIVHSWVLLRVGNLKPRAKQLADTITAGSRSKNLGLNNTIFGKVKQVRLSSVFSSASSPAPAPSPLPHNHHGHHHHHHHHHHLSPFMAPEASPTPQPSSPASHGSPMKAPEAPPPCESGNRRRDRGDSPARRPHLAPTPAHAPYLSPRQSARPPHQHVDPPAAPKSHIVPVSAPLPHVVYTHAQPPSKSRPHDHNTISPSPSSSNTAASSGFFHWTVSLILMAAGLQV